MFSTGITALARDAGCTAGRLIDQGKISAARYNAVTQAEIVTEEFG